MKGKLALLAGAAIGYVFGTRAGRERYEQLKSSVTHAWRDPRIQERVNEAEHFISDTAKSTVPQMQERVTETARSAVDAARTRFGGGRDDYDAEEPATPHHEGSHEHHSH